MQKIIIIHYHEIALKGKNRSFFEEALLKNIKISLKSEKIMSASRISGRIIISLNADSDLESISGRLKKVFGIAYFVVGFEGSRDLEKLQDEIWSLIKNESFKSFRVTAKRGDKSFKYDSQETGMLIGSYIWQQIERAGGTPRVDLKNADINAVIEITYNGVFFYFIYNDYENHKFIGKIKGLSGFPSGTSGRLVSLISGGFDSPVASWKMMRRGANLVFIHFHSYPSTSLASKENVKELIRVLTNYQFYSKAYFVPFLNIQKAIMLNCNPDYGVILYRRFMMRLSDEIAKKENAKALVTGDSLGQVASQTLENIIAVSMAVELPILRPLIGENKEDIIELSEKIDTFKISSQSQEDCCSLFVPKHPVTKADLAVVEEMEKKLDVSELIGDALNRAEIEEFRYE